jgi:hypothetical protein
MSNLIVFAGSPSYDGPMTIAFTRADSHRLSLTRGHSLIEWHGGKVIHDYGHVDDGLEFATILLAFLSG